MGVQARMQATLANFHQPWVYKTQSGCGFFFFYQKWVLTSVYGGIVNCQCG